MRPQPSDDFSLNRRAFWLIGVIATATASFLFAAGYSQLIYDAWGYYRLAQNLTERGLLGVAYEYRTYGYPLFVALATGFRRVAPETTRLFVFLAQLAVLLAVCAFSARRIARTLPRPGIALVFFAVAVGNPFVLAHATETLADLLSASLVLLAVVLSICPRDVGQEAVSGAAALFCAAFACVVRPVNVSILLPLGLLWIARLGRARPFRAGALAAVLAAAMLPFVPQMWINREAFGKPEPLVVARLYRDQTRWGMANLKYATSVVPGGPPEIAYGNPFYRGDPTLADFFRRSPLGYLATLALHLFSMLDHDFLFTYVTDLHPWYRWPLSTLNFLFLFLASVGLRAIRRGGTRVERAAASGILFCAAAYAAVHLPVAVESRFSLPLDLLATPFFAVGLISVAELVREGRRAELRRVALSAAITVSFALALSAWISARAPRLAAGPDKSAGNAATARRQTGVSLAEQFPNEADVNVNRRNRDELGEQLDGPRARLRAPRRTGREARRRGAVRHDESDHRLHA